MGPIGKKYIVLCNIWMCNSTYSRLGGQHAVSGQIDTQRRGWDGSGNAGLPASAWGGVSHAPGALRCRPRVGGGVLPLVGLLGPGGGLFLGHVGLAHLVL